MTRGSAGGLFVAMIFLSGCSTTGQDHFSTEPGKGLGWKSMSETHQLIQKSMGEGAGGSVVTPQPYIVSSTSVDTGVSGISASDTSVSGMSAFEGIQRIPEQYLRIWVPPYQDVQGNLHEESSIQTVIKSGQWKLPSPEIDEHRKA